MYFWNLSSWLKLTQLPVVRISDMLMPPLSSIPDITFWRTYGTSTMLELDKDQLMRVQYLKRAYGPNFVNCIRLKKSIHLRRRNIILFEIDFRLSLYYRSAAATKHQGKDMLLFVLMSWRRIVL